MVTQLVIQVVFGVVEFVAFLIPNWEHPAVFSLDYIDCSPTTLGCYAHQVGIGMAGAAYWFPVEVFLDLAQVVLGLLVIVMSVKLVLKIYAMARGGAS